MGRALLLPRIWRVGSGVLSDHPRRRLQTAEALCDPNAPRASTEANRQVLCRAARSVVGVVTFDSIFVPHDRAPRGVQLSASVQPGVLHTLREYGTPSRQ
jgi:hypothetical protein